MGEAVTQRPRRDSSEYRKHWYQTSPAAVVARQRANASKRAMAQLRHLFPHEYFRLYMVELAKEGVDGLTQPEKGNRRWSRLAQNT